MGTPLSAGVSGGGQIPQLKDNSLGLKGLGDLGLESLGLRGI